MNSPTCEPRTPSPRLVETQTVTFTVDSKRHGAIMVSGIVTSVDRFTYWIDLPQFPEVETTSESVREVIYFATDQLLRLFDRHSAAYWKKRGIL